jgi:hypothetical protein
MSSYDAADAAVQYLLSGYKPLPLSNGSKAPGFPDWPNFRTSPEKARQDFPPGSNVGLIMGDGIVCVDLDDEAVITLAAEFLPETGCVIGRPGRPGCHWFYRINGTHKTIRFKANGRDDKGNPKAKGLLDFLCDGSQVVVGPSIHPGGDIYERLEGEPAMADAMVLLECIHDLLEAAAPALAAKGLSFELPPQPKPRVPASVKATITIDGDQPGDAYSREHPGNLLARHGWAQVRQGRLNEYWRRSGKQSGISATLREIEGVWVFYNFSGSALNLSAPKGYSPFGLLAALEYQGDHKETARALREQGYGDSFSIIPMKAETATTALVPIAASSPPGPLEDFGNATPPGDDVELFPADCLSYPGFLEMVIDHNLRTCSRKQPELALAAALALLSVVTGNRIKSFVNHTTYTNLYVVGLGHTGSGKEHGRDVNQKILAAAGCPELQGPSRLGSHTGIIAALEEQATLLMPIDEFGDLLGIMQNAGGRAPYLAIIPAILKILKHQPGKEYRDSALATGVKKVTSPHLVIHGTTTPDGFWEGLTHAQVRDGLLSRCLVFESPGYAPLTCAIDEAPPEEIIRLVKFWREEFGGGGNLKDLSVGAHVSADVEEDAAERFLEHEKAIGDRQIQEAKVDPMRSAIWSRTAENSNQLALLAACSRVQGQPGEIPVITLADMNWAIKISNWMTRRLATRTKAKVSETPWDAILKKVQSKLYDGITERNFRRATRGIDPKDLKKAYDSLKDEGFIVGSEERTPPGGGPKSKIIRVATKGVGRPGG